MSIKPLSNPEKYSKEFKAVVKAINRCLEDSWTKKQLKKGMFFEIRDYWYPFYKDLVLKYREVGWVVQTQVEILPGERKVFLNIQHPTIYKLRK